MGRIYSATFLAGNVTTDEVISVAGFEVPRYDTYVLREVLALIPSGLTPEISATIGLYDVPDDIYYPLIRLFDNGYDNYATAAWTGRLVATPPYGIALLDTSVGGVVNWSFSGYNLTP
uniref:Uncharacterized protein n=1 Tax=uncultured prokaryote TaxID=198431 RepID=A0A0H5QN45_9ZZZZ|nr:hypothetical protein [uncultured prokaryote]